MNGLVTDVMSSTVGDLEPWEGVDASPTELLMYIEKFGCIYIYNIHVCSDMPFQVKDAPLYSRSFFFAGFFALVSHLADLAPFH